MIILGEFSQFLLNTCCGYSYEASWQGASTEYPYDFMVKYEKPNILP